VVGEVKIGGLDCFRLILSSCRCRLVDIPPVRICLVSLSFLLCACIACMLGLFGCGRFVDAVLLYVVCRFTRLVVYREAFQLCWRHLNISRLCRLVE
jgi:hypothetical protein